MINRRTLPLLVTCASLMLHTASFASSNTGTDDEKDLLNPPHRPNVILILADDLGFTDLGLYGSEIMTPNIDRLASQGMKFSNYHTSPTCAPSRAMLLTGVDSHLAGVANIPEAIPPELSQYDNYEGVLSRDVVTVASILNNSGYHTYMTGKWHLGKTEETLPYYRGFEKTLALADSGTDNYEQRPYIAIYDHAHWTRDGQETKLEEPFYSSELIVDEMINYIDSNIDDGEPFFSYLSFLAVHTPVQAPKAYSDLYMNTYKDGWRELRNARYEAAIDIDLLAGNTEMVQHDFVDDWDLLNEEEKLFEAKRMAVYAGMITAMDAQIGRLLDYLEEIGELEHTIFVITSDNGPEYNTIPKSQINSMGYTYDYEDLGEMGSMNFMGASWASASAAPLSYFKFYTGEGGLRVPLIISGVGIEKADDFNAAFTHVTDITPTLLALTDVEQPDGRFGGREVEVITGKDLTPIIEGKQREVYLDDEYVGFELAGNVALFNNGYKLIYNRGPLGDSVWYMYDIVNDPGETTDLKALNSVQFQRMLNLYGRYAKENGVQSVPDHYDQRMEINLKTLRNSAGHNVLIYILVSVTLLIFGMFGWQRKKFLSREDKER